MAAYAQLPNAKIFSRATICKAIWCVVYWPRLPHSMSAFMRVPANFKRMECLLRAETGRSKYRVISLSKTAQYLCLSFATYKRVKPSQNSKPGFQVF